ncbi:PREDICTED: plectin-like, partial [Priapulus caudatus]|uniref:Plectin-like n=1 Tax=Priapulus caudatus TaxID=37621 RepID=A0ABM1E7B4_PRICU
MKAVRHMTASQRIDQAFTVAEQQLGVTRLLDAEGKLGATVDPAMEFGISEHLEFAEVNMLWKRLMVSTQEMELALHQEISRLEKLQQTADKVNRDTRSLGVKLHTIDKRLADDELLIPGMPLADARFHCDQLEQVLKLADDALRGIYTAIQNLREDNYDQHETLTVGAAGLHRLLLALRDRYNRGVGAHMHRNLYLTEEYVITVTRTQEIRTEVKSSTDEKSSSSSLKRGAPPARARDDVGRRAATLERSEVTRRSEVTQRSDAARMERRTPDGMDDDGETAMRNGIVDTRPYYSRVQECMRWIENKRDILEAGLWGEDLESVQRHLADHKLQYTEISDFHTEVDKCSEDKTQFSGDELYTYMQLVSQLETKYSHLMDMAIRRLTMLESVEEFLREAAIELPWIRKRQQIELARDWGDTTVDITEVARYHETLVSEIEARVVKLMDLQQQGRDIIEMNHPSSKAVQVLLHQLETEWAWLMELRLCLSTHLEKVTTFHRFFKDVHECAKVISQAAEELRTKHGVRDVTMEEGERHLQDMEAVQQRLEEYDTMVASLVQRSKTIIPLKLRKQRIGSPRHASALCNYSSDEVTFHTDDDCLLLDNSQATRWRVRNTARQEDVCPSVCFLIPPPNDEAIELAQRLQKQLEQLKSLWRDQNTKLKVQMLYTAINMVKSWDLQQFKKLGPDRREQIITALQQDLSGLMAESKGSQQRELSSLQHEVRACIEVYTHFTTTLQREGDEKGLTDVLSTLLVTLDNAERMLETRCASPLPEDSDTLREYVSEHRDLQFHMQEQQSVLDKLQIDVSTVRSLVEHSRPRQTQHPDLDKLEMGAENLQQRWHVAQVQTADRRACVEKASDDLLVYQGELPIEREWLRVMGQRVEELPRISHQPEEARTQVQQALNFYKAVLERKPVIEKLNTVGGSYITEAKMFEMRLESYEETLDEARTAGRRSATSPKHRRRVQPGYETVSADLDE